VALFAEAIVDAAEQLLRLDVAAAGQVDREAHARAAGAFGALQHGNRVFPDVGRIQLEPHRLAAARFHDLLYGVGSLRRKRNVRVLRGGGARSAGFGILVEGAAAADRAQRDRRIGDCAEEVDLRVDLGHVDETARTNLVAAVTHLVRVQGPVGIGARREITEVRRRHVFARDRFHLEYVDDFSRILEALAERFLDFRREGFIR
jgi:hypothetical protein